MIEDRLKFLKKKEILEFSQRLIFNSVRNVPMQHSKHPKYSVVLSLLSIVVTAIYGKNFTLPTFAPISNMLFKPGAHSSIRTLH